MAATTVGLVYSRATGRLRRVIVPDNDTELRAAALHAGEALLTISTVQYSGDLQLQVNAFTRLTPSGDRYVSVDASNNVLTVNIADPAAGDAAPIAAAAFVAHATAAVGDLLWDGTLLPNRPLTWSNLIARRNQPLP